MGYFTLANHEFNIYKARNFNSEILNVISDIRPQ